MGRGGGLILPNAQKSAATPTHPLLTSACWNANWGVKISGLPIAGQQRLQSFHEFSCSGDTQAVNLLSELSAENLLSHLHS